MIEHICNILDEICVMMEIALFAHYVFLEPKWKRGQYYFNIVNVLILIVGEFLIGSEYSILLCLLCAGLNLSMARKKHRIRGFFLVIPIVGILGGSILAISDLLEMLFRIPSDISGRVIDMVMVLFLLLFLWKGKKWCEKFEMEIQYRKLQRWESRLLIGVGVMVFGLVAVLEGVSVKNMGSDMQIYIALSNLLAIILTLTVIVLVMQGNKRAYYENIAALNENYLNAEIRHFQAYQKAQVNTRRVRHDMKNHMQSLLYLAREEKYEELKQYIETLSTAVEQIDMELHCGNNLADAICNEKNELARHKGILFEIEGRMPEMLKIEPVDICTIFANALDNAIEALEDESIEKRWIKLEISSQGEILFLRFRNPVEDTKKDYLGTSKADRVNHGFGLQNIRMSVEKYHGEMKTELYTEETEHVFSLEIMLMTC